MMTNDQMYLVDYWGLAVEFLVCGKSRFVICTNIRYKHMA
jgi:hypothetical protein